MGMMKCPQCGSMVKDTDESCPKCTLALDKDSLGKYRFEHPGVLTCVNCPFCYKRINPKSTKCIHCGKEISSELMRTAKTKSDRMRVGISLLILLVIIIYVIAIKDTGKGGYAVESPAEIQEPLVAHTLISESMDETPVSNKVFVQLLVDKGVKRNELDKLLRHYMDAKKSAIQNKKKFIIEVVAYTDSLRYKRGEQWLGLLNLNEFQSIEPVISYDEVNLVDGSQKTPGNSEVSDQARQKVFYDISNSDFETSVIMDDIYPMSTIDFITFMKNERNRSKYLSEEESVQKQLDQYYMRKHSISQAQFDEILMEGFQKNWTQKSEDECKKILSNYKGIVRLPGK